MRFTLNAAQAAELRASALAGQNEADIAVIKNREDKARLSRELSKANAATPALEKAFKEANEAYNAVLDLRAGAIVEFDPTKSPSVKVLGYDPVTDTKPREYVGNNAWYSPCADNARSYIWQLPSRSSDAKYFVRWNASVALWVCECTSYAIRGTCWHATAVKNGVKKDYMSALYVVDEKGKSHGVKRFVNY